MARETFAPWADVVVDAPVMTADDLAALPDDPYKYELVEGRLVRMPPPTPPHGYFASRLGSRLTNFVEAHRLGAVFDNDTGFRLSPVGGPDTVLGPDVSFVRTERLPSLDPLEWSGYFRFAPDLAAEIASPGQYRPEMGAKAREWLAAGTRLVWILWPRKQTVDVWRAGSDEPATTLTVDDDLDGLDVVPGFRYRVADHFAGPRRAT